MVIQVWLGWPKKPQYDSNMRRTLCPRPVAMLSQIWFAWKDTKKAMDMLGSVFSERAMDLNWNVHLQVIPQKTAKARPEILIF